MAANSNVITKTYQFNIDINNIGVDKKIDDILGKFGKVQEISDNKVTIALDKNIEGYEYVEQKLSALVNHLNDALTIDQNTKQSLEDSVKQLEHLRELLESGLKGHNYKITYEQIGSSLKDLQKEYAETAKAADKLFSAENQGKNGSIFGIRKSGDISGLEQLKSAYIIIQEYMKEIEELYSSERWKKNPEAFKTLGEKTNALNTALKLVEDTTERMQKKLGDESFTLPGFDTQLLSQSRDRVDKIFDEVAQLTAELRDEAKTDIEQTNKQIEKLGNVANSPQKMETLAKTMEFFEKTIKNISEGKGAFNFWLEYQRAIENVGEIADQVLIKIRNLKKASENWTVKTSSGANIDLFGKTQEELSKMTKGSKKASAEVTSEVDKIKQSYDSLIKKIDEVGKKLETLISGGDASKIKPLITNIEISQNAKKKLVGDANKIIDTASKDPNLKKVLAEVSVTNKTDSKKDKDVKSTISIDTNSITSLYNDVKKIVSTISNSKDIEPIKVNIKPNKSVLESLPKDINTILEKHIDPKALNPVKVQIKPDEKVMDSIPKDVNTIINKHIKPESINPIKVKIALKEPKDIIKDINAAIRKIKASDIDPIKVKIKPSKDNLQSIPKDVNSIVNNYIDSKHLAPILLDVKPNEKQISNIKSGLNSIIKKIKPGDLNTITINVKPSKAVLKTLPNDVNAIIQNWIKPESINPVRVNVKPSLTSQTTLPKDINYLIEKYVQPHNIHPARIRIAPGINAANNLKKEINKIISEKVKPENLKTVTVNIKPDKKVLTSLPRDINTLLKNYIKEESLDPVKVRMVPGTSINQAYKELLTRINEINQLIRQKHQSFVIPITTKDHKDLGNFIRQLDNLKKVMANQKQIKINTNYFALDSMEKKLRHIAENFDGLLKKLVEVNISFATRIGACNKLLVKMRDLTAEVKANMAQLKNTGPNLKQITYNTNANQVGTSSSSGRSAERIYNNLVQSTEKLAAKMAIARQEIKGFDRDFIEANTDVQKFINTLMALRKTSVLDGNTMVMAEALFNSIKKNADASIRAASSTNELRAEYNNLTKEMSKMQTSQNYVNAFGNNLSEQYARGGREIHKAAEELRNFFAIMKNNPPQSMKDITEATKKFKELSSELEKAYTNAVPNSINKGASPFVTFVEPNNFDAVVAKIKEGSAAQGEFNTKIEIMATKANGLTRFIEKQEQNGTIIKKNVYDYDALTGAIYKVGIAQKELLTFSERVTAAFKRQAAQLVAQIGTFFSFYRIVATVREGITIVKEIDSAMTELRKVSEATETQLASFEKRSFDLGRQVGTTGKEIINSAASWSRLGYSIEEAGALAKAASIYLNVGDSLESIDVATDHLVSTMKAFNIEAEDSMQVVDALNEVANSFATSAGDIGEGLKRSSSALAVAGNDLNQSIAMFTAAQEIVQNAESVGTALRTVSLRLRGTKVELEQAGEETEGMAESTSKLRAQVMALTNVTGEGGVDILSGTADEYRSMYDIFADIAKVWKDMNDMDQAALLELLAGKVRANTVASMLNNWSQAEAALQTATESAGSALRENERYLNSIEGKLAQLTTSWQEMWNNALNTGYVKFFVDVLRYVVELVDNIGAIPLIVGTISGIITAINYDKFSSLIRDLKSLNDLKGQGFLNFDLKNIAKRKSPITSDIGSELVNLDGGFLGSEATKSIHEYKRVLEELEVDFEKNGQLTKALAKDNDSLTATMKKNVAACESSAAATKMKANADRLGAAQAKLHMYAEQAKQVAITAGMAIAVTALVSYIAKQKEYNKELDESNKKAKEQIIDEGKRASTLLRSAAAYQSAKEAYQSNPTKETEYRDAVQSVVSALGDKAKALEGVSEESQEYILMLEKLIKEEQELAAQRTQNARQSLRELIDTDLGEGKGKRRSVNVDGKNMPSTEGREGFHDIGVNVTFTYDTTNYQEILTRYDSLRQYLKDWEEQAEQSGEVLSRNGSYKRLKKELSDLEKYYADIIRTDIEAFDAQERLAGRVMETADDYEKWKNALYDFAGVSEDNKKLYDEIAKNSYPKLAMELEEQTRLTEKLTASRANENKEVKEAVQAYDQIKKEMEELGVKQTDIKFGNINLDNRQVIEWTDELKKKFKDSIKDWFTEEEAKQLNGQISTVLGAWDNNFKGLEGIPIAFSPILQGKDGAPPELLTEETVYKYIETVIAKVKNDHGDDFTFEDIIKLDASGLEIDGKHISGLIADIGDTAEKTAEKMHYVGQDGALSKAFDDIAIAAENAGVTMEQALSTDLADKVKLTSDEIEQLTQKLEEAGHTTMANTMLEDTDFMLNKNIDSVEEFIQTLDEYIAELNKAANEGRDFVDQVNAQAEAIDKLQETYSSVKGIVEATFSGSMDNSSYLDALQTLATQISELGDKGEDARDKLNAMFANLEYGNLHQLGDLAEQVATQQMAKFWEEFEKNGVTLSPAVKDAITQMTVMEEKLKGATTGLQNIASAYNTVASAIDDFNENGVITLSNLTSLLSLEPQYLAMLDIENGKLVMNEQVMKSLVQARIDDAKAATYESAAAEINAIVVAAEARAQGEAALAAEDSAQASNDAAIQAANVANTMGAAISPIAQYTRALSDARKVEGMTSDEQAEIRTIRERTEETIRILNNVGNNITTGSKKTRDTVMGHTNDAAKNAEDKAKEVKDKIKSNIDALVSAWKHAVDEGGMLFADYLDKLDALSKKWYNNGTLDYSDYIQYQHQVLEGRVELMEKAASAVQSYLGRQKDALSDQVEALQDQETLLEKEISAIEKSYNTLIKDLQKRSKELEKQQKAISKEVEAIEEGYEKTLEPLRKQLKLLEDQAKVLEKIISDINAYWDQFTVPLERKISDLENARDKVSDILEDINRGYDELIEPYSIQIDEKGTEVKNLQKIIKERQREIDLIKQRYEEQIKSNDAIIKGYQKQQKEIQKTIELYNAEIKKIEQRMKPLQDEQTVYNEEVHRLQDIQRVNNAEIRNLERLKAAQEDLLGPLENQLSALQASNDEREKAMQLARAEAALQRALNQRTKRVYTGGQFEYRTDNSAVRDAQDQLNSLRQSAEISSLEKAIENLKKPINEIDEQIAAINKKNQWISWDIEDIQDKLHELDDALIPYEKELDSVNEKIQTAQTEIDKWGKLVDELNEANELLTEKMEAELAPLEQIVENLESQIELIEDEIAALEEIVEQWERARTEATKYHQQELEGLEREIELLGRQARDYNHLREVQLRVHQDNLSDIQAQITALNDNISAIENERDAILDAKNKESNAIQKVIDKISEETEAYEEARDKETEAIQSQIDKLKEQEENLNAQIKQIEKYAEAWGKTIEKWQQIQDEKLLQNMFGPDWEQKLQSLDPTILNNFGDEYVRMCERLAEHNKIIIDNLSDVTKGIEDITNAASNGAEGIGGYVEEMEDLADETGKAKDSGNEYITALKIMKEEYDKGTTNSARFKEAQKKVKDAFNEGGEAANLSKEKYRKLQEAISKLSDESDPKKNKFFDFKRNIIDQQSFNPKKTFTAYVLEDLKNSNEEAHKLKQNLKEFINSSEFKESMSFKGVMSNALNPKIKVVNSTGVTVSRNTETLIRVKEKGGRVEIPTAAKGRRITANDIFDDIAKMVGEDTMVAAKVGEGIFTKRQTDDLEEFIQLTPSLIQSTKELQNIAKIFEAQLDHSNFLPTSVQNYIASAIQQSDKTAQGLAASTVNNTNNLNFTVGDITIQHAENASDLARQIKNNFPTAAYQAFMSV